MPRKLQVPRDLHVQGRFKLFGFTTQTRAKVGVATNISEVLPRLKRFLPIPNTEFVKYESAP